MTITESRPPRGSNLDSYAHEAVKAATGEWPRRIDPSGRKTRKTFVTVTGPIFHLRTYAGDSDDWFFGIRDGLWVPGQFFLLVCSGQPAMFVLPIDDLGYKWNFSIDYAGNRKLHIVGWGNHFELREARAVRLDRYRDAFDLLA